MGRGGTRRVGCHAVTKGGLGEGMRRVGNGGGREIMVTDSGDEGGTDLAFA